MTTIVIEGWRQVAHSYAMCLQQIELECLRRPDIQLYHTVAPYPDSSWRPDPNLFSSDQLARLLAVPDRPLGLTPDAVIRMTWPFNFQVDTSGCTTFVWGTTECHRVLSMAMGSGTAPEIELPNIASRIIAPSRWAAEGFIASGAPPDRVHVIPAGVDTTVMKPVDSTNHRERIRRAMGLEDSTVLLNIGAMTANKGVHLILHAMAILLERFPTLRLVLKGTDSLYVSKEMFANSTHLVPRHLLQRVASRIHYTGQTLSNQQLLDLYRAADLYVAPYLAEGFNLPVLEAGACGLPVICTAGGPTDDFVDASWCRKIRSRIETDNLGEELVPDLGHLVELLETSLLDEAWRRQASVSGPECVQQRFTWQHVVDQMVQLVQSTR